jgi:hypothetical protein
LLVKIAFISREAELQRQMRFETIAKANEKLYEQTDKIKSLRSGQLYGEVIETRNAQVYVFFLSKRCNA